jgi:hypothetical protein
MASMTGRTKCGPTASGPESTARLIFRGEAHGGFGERAERLHARVADDGVGIFHPANRRGDEPREMRQRVLVLRVRQGLEQAQDRAPRRGLRRRRALVAQALHHHGEVLGRHRRDQARQLVHRDARGVSVAEPRERIERLLLQQACVTLRRRERRHRGPSVPNPLRVPGRGSTHVWLTTTQDSNKYCENARSLIGNPPEPSL